MGASQFDEMDEQRPIGQRLPYKNAGGLSRALNNLKTEWQGWVEVVGPEKIPGGKNKSYWKIHQGPKLVLPIKHQAES